MQQIQRYLLIPASYNIPTHGSSPRAEHLVRTPAKYQLTVEFLAKIRELKSQVTYSSRPHHTIKQISHHPIAQPGCQKKERPSFTRHMPQKVSGEQSSESSAIGLFECCWPLPHKIAFKKLEHALWYCTGTMIACC